MITGDELNYVFEPPETCYFKPGMRVIYVPYSAGEDLRHQDVKPGTVTLVNEHWVFVKFDNDRIPPEDVAAIACDWKRLYRLEAPHEDG